MNKYLFFVVFIAFFFRFWQLGNNPPSLTWDEASWGYNAYALGIDGRDEFGKFLPLDYLESFGDFKPPVYAYLALLPVKILGLNEFAVRLPSAFFGVLTVLFTYFLTKRIFVNRGTTLNRTQNHPEYIALFSSFFLAISPWHINLSRAAFEANVATFFIVSGVWAFLAGVQEKKKYLILFAILLALSMHTFNSARIVAPLLALVLTIGFWREIFARKKEVFIASLVAFIILLPVIRFFMTPQAALRFREVNIFSDLGVIERANQEIANDKDVLWSKILHNRRFAFFVEYLRHYFDHFNPGFLFIKGDGNPKFSSQDIGQLYLWDLPFFILGVLILLKKKEGYWWIVPLWLLLGIVPAGIARETPHALRIESSLPTFQIIVAYGLFYSLKQISNIQIKNIVFTTLFFLLFINILYYLHGYYSHYAKQFSGEWQYGYKESINYVKSVARDYKQVIVALDMGRPYIYYLFYTKTDPRQFRKTAKVRKEALGFVHVDGFDKYIFARNFTLYHKFNQGTLYINTPRKVHPKGSILKEFRMLNGDTVLTAYVL